MTNLNERLTLGFLSISRLVEFAECTQGRTISLMWACKDKYKLVQDCMYQ